MDKWTPISKNQLLILIKESQTKMEKTEKRLWTLIQLSEPVKWEQNPWGNEGGGFWVVGIFGNKCIYYNDIEEGFNESVFKRWGTIHEYWCEQLGLHELIQRIMQP